MTQTPTGTARGKWADPLTIASGINAALLFALWTLERLVGETQWIVLILTYAPQVFYGLMTVFLIVASLVMRRWILLGLNALALGFVIFVLMGLRIHSSRLYNSSRGLTVMTYNVDKWGTGAAQIAAVVRAQDPDVVCLQEADEYFYVPGHQPAAFRRLLPDYRFVGQGELLVGSRLPILRSWATPLPPGPESRPALCVALSKNGLPVTVICVHLLPSQLDTKFSEPLPKFAADCRAFGRSRVAQSRELLTLARSMPPSYLMICGDYNAQPQAQACRMLTDEYYSDAFDEIGNGFGYTVTSGWPLTRIDHVLCGGGVDVRRAWVPDTRASDHRPLVAQVMLAI